MTKRPGENQGMCCSHGLLVFRPSIISPSLLPPMWGQHVSCLHVSANWHIIDEPLLTNMNQRQSMHSTHHWWAVIDQHESETIYAFYTIHLHGLQSWRTCLPPVSHQSLNCCPQISIIIMIRLFAFFEWASKPALTLLPFSNENSQTSIASRLFDFTQILDPSSTQMSFCRRKYCNNDKKDTIDVPRFPLLVSP